MTAAGYHPIPNADGIWVEFDIHGNGAYVIGMQPDGRPQIVSSGSVVKRRLGVIWYGPIPPATKEQVLATAVV